MGRIVAAAQQAVSTAKPFTPCAVERQPVGFKLAAGTSTHRSAMTATHRTLLTAAATLTLCGAALAGRPLATEDADYLESGKCEAEGFVAQVKPSGLASTNGWTLQGSCGVGLRTQVALAYSHSRSDGVTGSGLLLGGTRPASSPARATAWASRWPGASSPQRPQAARWITS
jgi:hypothetical protein